MTKEAIAKVDLGTIIASWDGSIVTVPLKQRSLPILPITHFVGIRPDTLTVSRNKGMVDAP